MYNFLLLWKMAWRNLWRQRRRSLITVFAMSAGLALCIPTYGLMEGVSREMIRGITRSHLGHVQVHHPDYLEERRLELSFPEKEASLAVLADPAVIQAAPRVYTGGMVSSEHEFEVHVGTIGTHGGGLQSLVSGSLPLKKCTALVDERTAKRWRLDLGSILRFSPLPAEPACERVEISGVVRSDPAGASSLLMRPADIADLNAPPKAKSAAQTDPDDIDSLEKLAPAAPSADATPMLAPASDAAPDAAPAVDAAPAAPPPAAPSPSPATPADNPTTVVFRVVRTASSQVGIIAVDPSRESQVTTMVDKVVAGTYLNNTYRNGQGVPQILIGDQLARILMVKPGDRLGLDILTREGFPMDEMVEVAGMFNSGLDSMDRSLTFVHLRMAWDPELMNLVDPKTGAPQIHELAIRIKDSLDNVVVAERLQKRLKGLHLVAWPWQKVEPAMASMVKLQDASTAILLLIIFAIAALGTMNTMLMSVFERIREFGVLKSVGMRPFFVARLIMLETLLMTLVSMVVGGVLGLGISSYLYVYGLDMSSLLPEGFSYQGVVIDPVWRTVISVRSFAIPLALMSLVSLIVAVWPAVRAARIKPVEALRQTGV